MHEIILTTVIISIIIIVTICLYNAVYVNGYNI
nr:MAG TPA_asm: hypothetical protein [Bacteriophage sp.]